MKIVNLFGSFITPQLSGDRSDKISHGHAVTDSIHGPVLNNTGQPVDGHLEAGFCLGGSRHRLQLADQVRVVGANLENGLLDIKLERLVPEAAKPRKVEIGNASHPRVVDAVKSEAA